MFEEKGRTPTGIYGLDGLISGGFRNNTINVVLGGTGVGKTTFALQYSLYGLNRGDKVVYVSLEMSDKQIIRDCLDLGWKDIKEHIEKGNLKILHFFGEDLTFPSLDFIEMVKKSMPYPDPRIVIDPLTYPTFYSNKEKRKSLSTIFQELRKLGTIVAVLEQPANGKTTENGCAMPLYLSDTVIYLQYLGFGELYNRTLRIIKHRGSNHGEGLYPYSIEKGLGIVVMPSEKQIECVRPKNKFDDKFKKAIKRTESMGVLGKRLSARIEVLRNNWTRDEDPSEILDMVLKEEQ